LKDDNSENVLEPKTVYLHVTKACNMHCTYCYFEAGTPIENELTLDELRVLFRELVSIKPQTLVFTGGEPLLRKDLFDMAQAFRKANPDKTIRLRLISNGTLINRENARRIAFAFDEVRISVDGPRAINDKIRGAGTFESAMNAIRNLRDSGIYPSVSITITSLNISHLQSFLSFLFRKKFITEFHLSPFRPVGRGASVRNLEYPWRKAQLVVANFWQKQFEAPRKLKEPKAYSLMSCRNCGVGSYINIHPDGAIYPCHVLSVPEFLLGNVRTQSLSKMCRNSTLLKTLRSLDFNQIAGVSGRLASLLENAICLGEVYRDAKDELMSLLKQQSK